MKKKILIIAAVIMVLMIATAAAWNLITERYPNLVMKMTAQRLKEDKSVDVNYDYIVDQSQETLVYSFVPEASGEYKFVLTDITSDEGVIVLMSVMDKNLSDFIVVNNYADSEDAHGRPDVLEGDAFLQKGQKCYAVLDVFPDDDSIESYSGSFKITVSKITDEDKPVELKENESVELEVKSDEQKCAVFTPTESGYYMLDSTIVSEDASSGFSSIAAITAADNMKHYLTNGICTLDKGEEYYIWVTVSETGKKTSQVSLSCTKMSAVNVTGHCVLDITEPTVIEYRAQDDENLAVYSVSEGDPASLIYERPGFPLRTDDNSEVSLSDNRDDFAMVLTCERDTTYRICIYGDFTTCQVNLANYIGDGSTLTFDDIEKIVLKQSTEDGEEDEGVVQEEGEGSETTEDAAETDEDAANENTDDENTEGE